jgi:hypothetical protein
VRINETKQVLVLIGFIPQHPVEGNSSQSTELDSTRSRTFLTKCSNGCADQD